MMFMLLLLQIFQRYSSTRLLSKLSLDMDKEKMAIEKLKEACGHDYTSKLYRMYQDVEKSKALINEYQNVSFCVYGRQRVKNRN